MTDRAERDALSHRIKQAAADISDTTRLAAAPLTEMNHRPRSHGRSFSVGLALVATLLVGIGTYVATTGGAPAPHARPQTSRSSGSLSGGTIRLAAATFRLPEGFHSQATQCAPTPAGLDAVRFTGSSYTASAAAGGRCLSTWLGASGPAPSGSAAVTVGAYQGALATDRVTGFSTLYVTIPADLYLHVVSSTGGANASATLDLVLSAKGLSTAELVAIAASGIPTHAASFGTCNSDCG
jgi:hypothetical protein